MAPLSTGQSSTENKRLPPRKEVRGLCTRPFRDNLVGVRKGKASLLKISQYLERILNLELLIEGEGKDRVSLEADLFVDPATVLCS